MENILLPVIGLIIGGLLVFFIYQSFLRKNFARKEEINEANKPIAQLRIENAAHFLVTVKT